LQRIVLALGVSDAKLEAGSMRFDANVSVRLVGSTTLGTRTETKNVNSLRSLQRAIDFEIERQIEVLESGGTINQETRHWNEDTGVTTSMRTKEESEDYRYFQDPDLLPLEVTREWQDEIRATIGELPAQTRARFRASGVDAETALILVDDTNLAAMFTDTMIHDVSGRLIGIWLTGEVIAYLRRSEVGLGDTGLTADHLALLAAMVDGGDLSSSAAKEVLIAVLDGEGSPGEIADAKDLLQVSDAGAIEEAVDAVLGDNADAVDKIRSGDMKPFGFLVGQVMRHMGGKADPKVVRTVLEQKTT
jgi:aspartyl-tRNA(Asn)/glutamyl-tRNA(Gln) amidotransferase subunit B